MKKQIPKGQLDCVVDRFHIGTPDSEIEADIRRMCGNLNLTPGLINAAVKYALRRHDNNVSLYQRIVRAF